MYMYIICMYIYIYIHISCMYIFIYMYTYYFLDFYSCCKPMNLDFDGIFAFNDGPDQLQEREGKGGGKMSVRSSTLSDLPRR